MMKTNFLQMLKRFHILLCDKVTIFLQIKLKIYLLIEDQNLTYTISFILEISPEYLRRGEL